MPQSTKKRWSLCIGTEIFLAVIIAVLTVFERDALVSLLFSFTFIAAFGYVAFDIISRKKANGGMLLAALCVFSVVCDGLLANSSFSFDYFKKVIMFSTFVLLLYYVTKQENVLLPFVKKILEYFPVALGFFFVFSCYVMEKGALSGKALTLGFTNPNFLAMWLLHAFLFGALFVLKAFSGGSKLRVLYTPVLFLLIKLIEKTEARACLLSVYAFLVFLVLIPVLRKIPRLFSLCITLLPIVLAIVYLAVADSDWFQAVFAFADSEGKDIRSRVVIWENAFEHFRSSPIFGSYAGISHGTGQSQMHNTHVDVLCSYGVFPFFVFLKILYDRMVISWEKTDSVYTSAAIVSFCAVIVSGAFEAAIVAGATGLNFLSLGLLLLARPKENREKIRR